MIIRLKNQGDIEISEGSTIRDLVLKLNLINPSEAVTTAVNGQLVDLSTILSDKDLVEIFNFDHLQGKQVFWHTSAHILAQAVIRLWPEAKPTIGPPIENGFYYDFANLTISESDLVKIEKEMQAIIKENFATNRSEIESKAAACKIFHDNPYKLELIQSFEDNSPISTYSQGEFLDLCRGPHLFNLGKIKAVKVLKTAGAYWRGDSNNEMLTRIYAISFPDKAMLKEYLHQVEEAKKRDHKTLGPKLDLFSLREEAPGMPFIHPKGLVVWNELLNFLRAKLDEHDYIEIKTPSMMTKDLWVTSGHWQNYRQNMFTSQIEERDFAIKPMNCPGCMLFYKHKSHSYRDLPLRVAEIGNVHRYEPSGSLSGLFRVRSFHQDDAHIFMKPEDIQKEIVSVINFADDIYSTFGLSYRLELSTRPEKNTVGTDQEWEMATKGLQGALDEIGQEYLINEGDGAFYGPKIDFHIKDAINRSWQCGTIQLDMSLPEKFDLDYKAQDGTLKRPVMIHRAIFGSIERFFGILIEHFSGKFPLWLSPNQVRILTIADRHIDYAQQVAEKLKRAGLRVEVDKSSESVNKKVRNAQLAQCNYILTTGDAEVESEKVSLRTRDNRVHGEIEVADFIEKLSQEVQNKLLNSVYSE